MKRTSVQLFRLAAGGKARFVSARGLLSKPLPRSGGIAIPAKGSASWSVTVKTAKLPKGSYRLKVSTYDLTGNTRTLAVRLVTVR